MPDALALLKTRLATAHDLKTAAAVLDWDQETYMPASGTEARSRQSATLQRLAHEWFTADETAALLERATPETAIDADLLRVARRDIERERRIPSRLVADLAAASARAKDAWRDAREADDFGMFEPHLARIVALCREKAEAVGYAESPYDALVDEYEPGMTTRAIATIFSDLRSELVPMIAAIAGAARPGGDAILRRPYDVDRQWTFGMRVMKDIGFDFRRGRQDESAHPFTTTFAVNDVRLTTRLHPEHFAPAFFGSLHEAGHGLYEQGVDPELDGTLLGSGTSLGIHESQSRLWENLVGRSEPFWAHYFPVLRETFPVTLEGVDVDAFVRAVNHVSPSPIRIESDEVTYNLHIMVRFEMETALISGELRAADVPDAWNARMDDFLGIRPDSDADGCLQDIHWSLGILGYFPTYALGNLMSAQLWNAARRDLPGLEDDIRAARFGPLLAWLRTHVHRHGRRKSADEILRAATGHGLRAEDWLAYVRSKYGGLYDIAL